MMPHPGMVPHHGMMARPGFFGGRQGVRSPFGAPTQKIYGALPADAGEEEQGKGAPDKPGLAHLSLHPDGARRARIDIWQIVLCSLLPVAVYAATAAVLSFRLHFSMCFLAWAIAVLCIIPSIYAAYFGWKAFRDDESLQAKWMFFLAFLCGLAWLIGVILGTSNYSSNMKPYYVMSGLNYYPGVDPSTSGESHIDAGRVLFQPGSHLDLSRAMGVRISETYCVAPVVNKNHPKGLDVQYDYWAVGVGCCSSVQPQAKFTCPGAQNRLANGGLRLMEDSQRPYFRMAVQEAEATYKIRAKHPIFLRWMEDPTAKMLSWSDAGPRTYWEGFFSVLVLMLFLSIVAAIYLSRASMESHACKGIGFMKYVSLNPDHDFIAEEGWGEPRATKEVTL